MVHCGDFSFEFLSGDRHFSHFLKELLIIFGADGGYISCQFRAIISSPFLETFEIFRSHSDDLIPPFLCHFHEGISRDLRDVF